MFTLILVRYSFCVKSWIHVDYCGGVICMPISHHLRIYRYSGPDKSDRPWQEREEQAVVHTTNGIAESVSTWDTDWSSYPSVDITPAKLHTEEISINESFGESNKQASPTPLQSADYDLSYFETFGVCHLYYPFLFLRL